MASNKRYQANRSKSPQPETNEARTPPLIYGSPDSGANTTPPRKATMRHTNSHEKTATRVGASGALTAVRTVAVFASVLLTAACASQADLDREATETNNALATANQAKAEADQALVAAQQAQASAQSANERADKMFQRNLHK